MRAFLPALLLLCLLQLPAHAQIGCASHEYYNESLRSDPALARKMEEIDRLVQRSSARTGSTNPILSGAAAGLPATIKIPVVVHVIYSSPDQNISDAQVLSQLKVLNEDYNRLNADTVNTPITFRSRAANTYIEFSLATIDPQGYATSGIRRKHTNTYSFGLDDGIKRSATGGEDGWDPDKYLNIWVGRLNAGLMGYSSLAGGAKEKDGIVISYTAFGTMGTAVAPYNKGRTATHETGHWLGLIHIWGDMYCGDDKVDDTPPQSINTRGCPSGIVSSCNNGPNGNMYMNYMDLTNDACMNMFTAGQAARMRSLFLPEGPRHALLFSNGCSAVALPGNSPADSAASFTSFSVYPNPASDFITIRPGTGQRLAGKTVMVLNHLGQVVLTTTIVGNHAPQVNVSGLRPGLYFVKMGGEKRVYKMVKS